MRQVDVAVVGAGQAGLAASYHLSRRGIEHVVFERGRVAEAWRTRRWDSFTLVGPNWSFDLPGRPYDGDDAHGFMLRAEIVDRFADYARHIGAPVEEGIDVRRVGRDPAGENLILETNDGAVSARAVVAATGAYQRPHRPPSDLDPSLLQLHTDGYRNAGDLPPGGVVVIGTGQSGSQIAEDLVRAGRSVWQSAGTCGWLPRRYRGRDNVDWRQEMGVFDQSVEQVGPALRLAAPPIQTGADGGRDLNLRTLAAAGVRLTGRLRVAAGMRATFDPQVEATAAASDEVARTFRATVDGFISARGIDAPLEPPPPAGQPIADGPAELDLRAQNIRTVVWATGFRLDYSWIDLDLGLTEHGYPTQSQGVSPQRGLYFLGLQLMHTRKSGLIFGVGEDAEHVAAVIGRQLGA